MTWDIPGAVECKKAAAASKQVVQIGLQHESSGELKDALRWIRDGKVGKVCSVDAWMSRNTPIGKGQWVRPVPSDCNPDHVNWKLFLDGRKEPKFDGFKYINWRLFWEFSGGNNDGKHGAPDCVDHHGARSGCAEGRDDERAAFSPRKTNARCRTQSWCRSNIRTCW